MATGHVANCNDPMTQRDLADPIRKGPDKPLASGNFDCIWDWQFGSNGIWQLQLGLGIWVKRDLTSHLGHWAMLGHMGQMS